MSTDTGPVEFILRTADLRERRAKAVVGRGEWHVDFNGHGDLTLWTRTGPDDDRPQPVIATYELDRAIEGLFEHIATEADPALALAAVRRWRGVVERHAPAEIPHMVGTGGHGLRQDGITLVCRVCCGPSDWPCPDLLETAAEARAYLGGAEPETASVPAERLRGGGV